MKIDKNSWHYKAYAFTYDQRYFVPEHTNLCQYFQRLLVVLPLQLLKFAFLFGCAGLLIVFYYLVMTPLAFPFGYKPTYVFGSSSEIMVPYRGLKLWGVELYPWHFLVLVLGGVLEWTWIHEQGLKHILIVQGISLGVLALIALIIGFLLSDTWEVIWKYLSAKKQGICPLVEFTKDEGTK